MWKWARLPSPAILTEKWEEFGKRYSKNREQDAGFKFQWPTINGEKLNHILLPTLKAQTQEHCSYCDAWPARLGDDSVDHFKPKSLPAFYKEVCKWENLYLACDACQRAKLSDFDNELLRPDADDYSFEKYFVYNFNTHEIEVNPVASEADQRRAEKTRTILQLNEIGLVKTRRKDFLGAIANNFPLEEVAFRFMF